MNLRTKAGRPAKKEAPPPLGTRQLLYHEWLKVNGLEHDDDRLDEYTRRAVDDAERWRQFSGRYSPSTPVAA